MGDVPAALEHQPGQTARLRLTGLRDAAWTEMRQYSLGRTFDPRSNSIGFLRLLLALLVIVNHVYPLGGFGSQEDPLYDFTRGQVDIGAIAVGGFFVLSGFLITGSFLANPRLLDFFWRRALRIFPGYWMCLVVVACLFAPFAWWTEHGDTFGVFSTPYDSPWNFIRSNWHLTLRQLNIAGLWSSTPYAHSIHDMAADGPLWTLYAEFQCYVGTALVGLIGLRFRRRWLLLVFALLVGVARATSDLSPALAAEFLHHLPPRVNTELFSRLTFQFIVGAVFFVYRDRLIISRWSAVAALVVAITTILAGVYPGVGEVCTAYLWIWLAVHLPLRRVDSRGDFSYGVYIYAWPVQQALALYGLYRWGVVPFLVLSVLFTMPFAMASWYFVERPALSLKWISPSMLLAGLPARLTAWMAWQSPAPAQPGQPHSGSN
ncbi:MAG: acyltransferase [Chloroflexi bacterium]|nr:acyltransferase [Chloroflexota bacterium]